MKIKLDEGITVYINGSWISSDRRVKVINPGTGELFESVYTVGPKESHQAIEAASPIRINN